MNHTRSSHFFKLISTLSLVAATAGCTVINDPAGAGAAASPPTPPAIDSSSPVLGDRAQLAVTALGITGPVSLRLATGATIEVLHVTADGEFEFAEPLALGQAYELTLEGGVPCLLDEDSGLIDHASHVALTCEGVVALGDLDFGAYAALTPTFSPDVLEYTVGVSTLGYLVHASAATVYASATIKFGERPPSSQLATSIILPSQFFDLAGDAPLTFEVTHPSGHARTYRVSVNRNVQPKGDVMIKSPVADLHGHHGAAVAMSGDTLVVGAPDFYENDRGAVFVYRFGPAGWAREASILSIIAASGNRFGASVAIDGDLLVVGAPNESSGGSGINPAPGGTGKPNSGAVEVFRRTGTEWSSLGFIKRVNPAVDDYFGVAVAISGDRFIVGAPGVDSGPVIINGAQNYGAAYAYEVIGSTLISRPLRSPSRIRPNNQFGTSVAMAGDYAVIGAIGDATPSAQSLDQTVIDAGAAYLLAWNGTIFASQATLKHPYPGAKDFMGYAVDITVADGGPTVYVGVPRDDSSSYLVDNEGATDSGVIFEYIHPSGAAPRPTSGFKGFPVKPGAQLGRAISTHDGMVAAGYTHDSSAGIGYDAGSTGLLANSGAAYLYNRAAQSQFAFIKSIKPEANQLFGASIAIGPAGLAIGAPAESSNASDVHVLGSSPLSPLADSGAVFFYR